MKMIKSFYEWMENHNYSPKTIQNYSICLNKFWSFCRDVGFYDIGECPEKISKPMVEMFISHLRNIQSVCPKTINLYLHSVRSYLKFLYIEQGRVVLDWKRISLLKEEQKQIAYLERDEIEKLIQCAKKEKEPLKRVRNSLMIKILFMTWLRVSELINIKVSEIQEEMQILGKGRKLRTVYIPTEVLKLAEYYVWRRRARMGDAEYLFVSHSKNSFGKKISRNAVEFYMKKYGFYCGFTKRTSPHVLRHSFATAIYRKWALSKDVQVLLGHEHLSTTEKYIWTNSEYVKKTAMLAR